jgi:hypothetical protein
VLPAFGCALSVPPHNNSLEAFVLCAAVAQGKLPNDEGTATQVTDRLQQQYGTNSVALISYAQMGCPELDPLLHSLDSEVSASREISTKSSQ